jgi:Secretion system C-terminal sorting domain
MLALILMNMTFLGEQDQSTLLEKETLNDVQIQVVPNPNNGDFRIVSNSQITEITVVDLTGKLVYKSLSNEDNLYNTGLKKGIYFIKVILQSGFEKIVKIEIN